MTRAVLRRLFFVGLLACLALGVPPLAAAEDRPPNIVLIFADDAGYADFGFQGSEQFRTPRLDALAERGLRFTNAYVMSPGCGPSRAALMTGRYPQEYGYTWNNVPGSMASASKLLGKEMGLPPEQTTIAEALDPLGYRSMAIGKWHLGGADRYHPTKQGFDAFYGFRGGARRYFPYKEPGPHSLRGIERGFENYVEPEEYTTDAFGREACRFIRKNQDRPFFVYLSFNAVHGPLHAKEEDLARFPSLEGKRKKLAAMTWAMDRAVGKVLDELDRLGLRENTMVVFTNDNGGAVGTSARNDPLSGAKGTLLEGGIRVPWLMHWPGRWEGGKDVGSIVSTLDLLPTFVSAANGDLSNHPEVDGLPLDRYLSKPPAKRPTRSLYWREGPMFAVRRGNMKLLDFPDRPAMLFDLSQDISETNDLAWEQRKTLRKLHKDLYEWRKTHARPLWMFKPKHDFGEVQRAYNHWPITD